MNLKSAKRLMVLFSVVALIIALIFRNTAVSTVVALICVLASLLILYPNLAVLSNISENNPKVKTLKSVTRFNVTFIAVVLALVAAVKFIDNSRLLAGLINALSEEQLNISSKLVMAFILVVPMLFYGNISPQIPFNRYTGLRLPWTVRDEECWIVAHRVLAYTSLPTAILIFVNVPTDMPLDVYVKYWWLGGFAIWIGIPALISAVFYYGKWKRKL